MLYGAWASRTAAGLHRRQAAKSELLVQVLKMVEASTAFAIEHLAPGAGRDCYAAQLLLRYSQLFNSTEVAVMFLPDGIGPYQPHRS